MYKTNKKRCDCYKCYINQECDYFVIIYKYDSQYQLENKGITQ